MQYTVVFTPEAEEQLVELYRYIAQAASPEIAQGYTDAIGISNAFSASTTYRAVCFYQTTTQQTGSA